MNWVVGNLQNALNTWNGKLSEIWTLLTQSPETFKGGSIWEVIVNINGALQAIRFSIVSSVLFSWNSKNLWQFCRSKKARISAKTICTICISKSRNNLWTRVSVGNI